MHNELFTYTPFPNVAPINVTHYGANYPWTAFDAKNVYGYEFNIPVFQDPPASFLVSEEYESPAKLFNIWVLKLICSYNFSVLALFV